MYRCECCGEVFQQPEFRKFCYEEHFGVSSIFPNKNYGEYAVCPECGSKRIDDYYEDEEENEDE